MGSIQLREADKLEIVVLIDNYSDQLLEDSDIANVFVRRPLMRQWRNPVCRF